MFEDRDAEELLRQMGRAILDLWKEAERNAEEYHKRLAGQTFGAGENPEVQYQLGYSGGYIDALKLVYSDYESISEDGEYPVGYWE